MALLEVELRRHGLQVVSVPAQDAIPCAGIGGQAKIKRIVDAPVGVAGIHGLLRFTVLADTDKFQTPPLLPISFLEAVGAIIDLSSDCLRTPDGHEAKMTRLPSGHRSVNILEFGDSAWRLPSAIQDGNDPFRVVCVQAAVKSQFQGGEGDEGNAAIPLSTAATSSNFTATAATSSNFTVEDGAEGNEPDEHAAVWATLQENGIEDRARILLEHADFSAEAMEDLLSMVSFHGKNGRDVLVLKRKDAGAAAFGIYVHGNMCGITNVTNRFPNFVKYVNRWFRVYMKSHMGQVWPDRWTSFSVNVNMSSRPHQDCHNANGSDNVLATFGSFQGGGLWREVSASAVQERGESVRWKMRRGKRVPGEVVDTFHNPTVFDPKGVHATMAWTGKRISITLYTVRAHDQVCGSDIDRLQELAFPGLTAVHYMEASCTEHGGHEARQAMECEHDFETVF